MPETANEIVTKLALVTATDTSRGASILPLDLNAAIFVLDASIEYVVKQLYIFGMHLCTCYSSIAEMNPELLQQVEFVNVHK